MEESNLKISIITICFNNEEDIRSTIESVINQTYENIEYIIIDGESSDNTMAIIDEYSSHISKIISEPDRGMYDAINKGIKYASGDVVGLIHASDQLYDKWVISKIAKHFVSNDIDAMYGHSILVNKKGVPVRVNKSPRFKKSLFRIGWMPSHQSVYLKREVFEKLGYYRTDLGGSADYEFILRIFYFNQLKVKRLNEFIIRFFLGGISTSNYHKILDTQATHIKCWELNGENPPKYLIPLKLLRKIPQFYKALIIRKKYVREL